MVGHGGADDEEQVRLVEEVSEGAIAADAPELSDAEAEGVVVGEGALAGGGAGDGGAEGFGELAQFAVASASMTPRPTQMMGRLAFRRAWAAFSMVAGSGGGVAASREGRISMSECLSKRSVGISSSMGRGLRRRSVGRLRGSSRAGIRGCR